MAYTILGLGNPEVEYRNTRHNAGAIVVDTISREISSSDWKNDSIKKSLISKGEIGGEKVILIKPQSFMNKSGVAIKDLVGLPKKIANLIVIHDDIDLPLGSLKIVFNRGSGGHKGVESIVRTLKSNSFVRIRVGVTPTTPGGKLKKPEHNKLVDFIVGEFKKPELLIINKISKTVYEAIEMLIEEGLNKAMTNFN